MPRIGPSASDPIPAEREHSSRCALDHIQQYFGRCQSEARKLPNRSIVSSSVRPLVTHARRTDWPSNLAFETQNRPSSWTAFTQRSTSALPFGGTKHATPIGEEFTRFQPLVTRDSASRSVSRIERSTCSANPFQPAEQSAKNIFKPMKRRDHCIEFE